MKIMNKVLIIALLVLNSCRGQAQTQAPLFLGTWTIFGFQSGFISAMTDDEAKLFIGQKVFLGENVYIVDGKKNPDVRYEVINVNAIEYFTPFRFHPDNVNITDESIQIIKIFSEGSRQPFQELIWNRDKLILFKDGYFFQLKR